MEYIIPYFELIVLALLVLILFYCSWLKGKISSQDYYLNFISEQIEKLKKRIDDLEK